jgi:DNA processing protein
MSSRRNTDPELDEAGLHAVLQLRMLPGLDDQSLKSLLSRYPPKLILEKATLRELGEKAWRARAAGALAQRVDRALDMIEKLAVSVITIRSQSYPRQLRHLEEFSPPILFCRGRTDLFSARSLALVGARDSTEYGDSVAELFAADLASRGVVVISGLARGIDAIAHQSALESGGTTIAALGCGVDVQYPPRNARLQERIAEEGLLISEFAPGEPAYPANFPRRNRLIALLGSGVLVVEAGPKSGTRKTVDWALNYGIPVFAVPGPIGRYESQGTNEIIQDGGKLVMSIRDVLDELNWQDLPHAPTSSGDAVHIMPDDPVTNTVYGKITLTASHIDVIARRCGLSVPETLMQLMQLELEGKVVQHPGKRFSRRITVPKRPGNGSGAGERRDG